MIHHRVLGTICCDLMVQPCGCVRQSEREPTQHKSHTMSRVFYFYFFTFFHTVFKIWMQEWRMQIAFGFLFFKKEIQKGGEGRREAPLKQPKYIHASSWLEFLVWCCRATAQRCSRYYIFVPRASLTEVSVDGMQVICMCDHRYSIMCRNVRLIPLFCLEL